MSKNMNQLLVADRRRHEEKCKRLECLCQRVLAGEDLQGEELAEFTAFQETFRVEESPKPSETHSAAWWWDQYNAAMKRLNDVRNS
jgi:hypothetical protein